MFNSINKAAQLPHWVNKEALPRGTKGMTDGRETLKR